MSGSGLKLVKSLEIIFFFITVSVLSIVFPVFSFSIILLIIKKPKSLLVVVSISFSINFRVPSASASFSPIFISAIIV